jgi:ribose transport system ATP-binding protein/rhamnose transport system ATP-binding protein
LSVGRAVKNLSFSARGGEILCIAGQVGSGADLVTRALAGLAPAATGRVSFAGRKAPLRSVPKSMARRIDFISDDRAGEGLFHTMRVLDNLVASNLHDHSMGGLLRWRRLREHALQSAERVGLDGGRLDSPVSALSGGNQQKILFGRVLRKGSPGLLLLNEPTRGVDVGARSELYRVMRMLSESGCALVMYSSDLEEILGLADVVLTIFKGSLVRRYEGLEIESSRILADITHPDARAQ